LFFVYVCFVCEKQSAHKELLILLSTPLGSQAMPLLSLSKKDKVEEINKG